jgi:hypoxanthine phosphoribosyltransferase
MEKQIQLADKVFELYIEEKTILNRIAELAMELNKFYAGKNPLFIAVLNGSFMFASDLMKQTEIDCSISFTRYESYKGTRSQGLVKQVMGLSEDPTGRYVVVLEDIIDSGCTMSQILSELRLKNPINIQIAALLYKENILFPRNEIDFIGFEIPHDFVVGYGLDYMGLGRNLRNIYKLI